MTFGQRLKKLREEKGISRDELAQKLDISYWTLSKYETDNRSPDHKTIVAIADYLGVTTDYILGRTDHHKTVGAYHKINDAAYKVLEQGVLPEYNIADIFQNENTKLTAGGQPLTRRQRLNLLRILNNPALLETIKDEKPQENKDLEKIIAGSNVTLNGIQLDAENKKDVITLLSVIKRHKQRELDGKSVEVLDLFNKPDALITVGGRTLSINEKIRILEFIKEEIIKDTEQVPFKHEMVIAASHQGDSVVQSPSEEDKEDILNAIKFAKEQHKRDK